MLTTNLHRRCSFVSEILIISVASLVPYFFNPFSARHFEADKVIVLRLCAIAVLALEIVAFLHRTDPPRSLRATIRFLVTTRARWILGAVFLFTISLLASTALSISPRLSFWGGYERRQGAYTGLAYIAIFALASARLDRLRCERLVTVMIQTAVAVSVYALAQFSGLDPMSWTFDVATRPASTMGNANTMAGYLVLVIPFVLWRFLNLIDQRSVSSKAAVGRFDWIWRSLVLVASQIFIIAHITAMAVAVQPTVELLRFLTAIAVASLTWAMRNADEFEIGQFRFALVSLVAVWLALSIVCLIGGSSARVAVIASVSLAIMLIWGIRGGAYPTTRRLNGAWLAIAGYGVSLIACFAAVIFAQGRGPLVALIASQVVLLNILLLRRSPRRWLAAMVTVQALLGAGLLILNISHHPLAACFRGLPYVGRLGQLLAFDEGTGLERVLIWRGDKYGGGVLSLVTTPSLRMLFGYGPETLRDAFDRVFPPSLVAGVWPGVVPDRAHQAELDVWATQGLVGLAAYLLIFGTTAAYSLKRLCESNDKRRLPLIAACASAVTAHFVDGLTEILSTSSIMTFLLIVSITISSNRDRKRLVQASLQREPAKTSWTTLGLVIAVALPLAWYENLAAAYADILFEAGRLAEREHSVQSLLTRCDSISKAKKLAPNEDFYVAQLGNLFIELQRRKETDRTTLRSYPMEPTCAAVAARGSARELLERARNELIEAYALDNASSYHAAALAHVNVLLHRAARDRDYLDEAIRWYRHAVTLAPNNVALLNDYATALASRSPGERRFAEHLLRESLERDRTFIDTHLRLGELLLVEGRHDAARSAYAYVLHNDAPSLLRTLNAQKFIAILNLLSTEDRRELSSALDRYRDELRQARESGWVSSDEHERMKVLTDEARTRVQGAIERQQP